MTVQAAAFELTDEPGEPGRMEAVRLARARRCRLLRTRLLGRTTIPDGTGPEPGLACRRRRRCCCSGWLRATAVVAGRAADRRHDGRPEHADRSHRDQAGIFVVSNIAQAICAVLIMPSLGPTAVGCRGRRAVEELRDFWPVLAGSVARLAGGRRGRRARSRDAAGQLVLDRPAGLVGAQRHRLRRRLHHRRARCRGLEGRAAPRRGCDAARGPGRPVRRGRPAGRVHRRDLHRRVRDRSPRCRSPSRCWCRPSGPGCGSARSASPCTAWPCARPSSSSPSTTGVPSRPSAPGARRCWSRSSSSAWSSASASCWRWAAASGSR